MDRRDPQYDSIHYALCMIEFARCADEICSMAVRLNVEEARTAYFKEVRDFSIDLISGPRLRAIKDMVVCYDEHNNTKRAWEDKVIYIMEFMVAHGNKNLSTLPDLFKSIIQSSGI